MNTYTLGGQAHLPGHANRPSSAYFTYTIEAHSDAAAIIRADEIFAAEQKHLESGMVLSATLWRRDRQLKHFSETKSLVLAI